MILLINAQGDARQHHGELSPDDLRDLNEGTLRAFKYDHVAVSFFEASIDLPSPTEIVKEGDEIQVTTLYRSAWNKVILR